MTGSFYSCLRISSEIGQLLLVTGGFQPISPSPPVPDFSARKSASCCQLCWPWDGRIGFPVNQSKPNLHLTQIQTHMLQLFTPFEKENFYQDVLNSLNKLRIKLFWSSFSWFPENSPWHSCYPATARQEGGIWWLCTPTTQSGQPKAGSSTPAVEYSTFTALLVVNSVVNQPVTFSPVHPVYTLQ